MGAVTHADCARLHVDFHTPRRSTTWLFGDPLHGLSLGDPLHGLSEIHYMASSEIHYMASRRSTTWPLGDPLYGLSEIHYMAFGYPLHGPLLIFHLAIGLAHDDLLC